MIVYNYLHEDDFNRRKKTALLGLKKTIIKRNRKRKKDKEKNIRQRLKITDRVAHKIPDASLHAIHHSGYWPLPPRISFVEVLGRDVYILRSSFVCYVCRAF